VKGWPGEDLVEPDQREEPLAKPVDLLVVVALDLLGHVAVVSRTSSSRLTWGMA
jgi:hypothetical protein